ncbi:MAG TPA: flagellar hook protein FlgE [Polyangiaceae bacterium]|nr:flagellar hook protein FlgE [Polyangiaceae bacterium]
MSILNAMYSGASGLDAESDALGVIGNNVSNSNTVGFKESRAVFESVMGAAPGSSDSIGSGVKMTSTQTDFTQGTLTTTGQPTDLALQGDGFFVVNGNVNGVTGNFYTRDGQTHIDNTGTLVNSDGLALQGYQTLPNGTMSSQVGNITLSTAALSPKPTDQVNVTANLNANATPPANPWDPTNPTATSNFSTTINVYDSLGNAHALDVYFTNTGANQWDYHIMANGSEVSGGTAGTAQEIGTGSLTFDSNGALQSDSVSLPATVTFNGATAQTINMNLGTPITPSGSGAAGTGLDGITQFGSASAVSAQSQDGYGPGSLSGVQIGADGTVSGTYSNGQTIAVGQLAIAKFQSNNGLAATGDNLFEATSASGDAALAAAGSGGRGSISSGSLEQSNVDIASQFVDLIAHQRAFQASSKTITTADQMLQDLMQVVQ